MTAMPLRIPSPLYTEHARTCPTCEGDFRGRVDCIDCAGWGSVPYRVALVAGQWWVMESDDAGNFAEGCRVGYVDDARQLASYEEHGLGGLSDHWPSDARFDGEVLAAFEVGE